MPATGRARARRALVVGAVAVGLLVGDPLSAALADPPATPPSAGDVADARRAVTDAEASVAQMEVRLAELAALADEAHVTVQRAGEDYTQALADADAARAAADTARARSTSADADAEAARQQLMAFARELARSGGSIETIEALLSADGFADVAERTAALSRLTGKADETVQNFRAAQLVADTMRSRAETAEVTATSAEAAAQTALDAAETAQKAADEQVAAAAVERDGLISRLAAARQTSADVERARQDELDRQRREREEAAAQAARLAPPPVTPPATGSSGNQGTPTQPPAPPNSPTQPTTPPPTTPPAQPTTPPPPPPSSSYPLGSGTSQGSAGQGAAAVEWAKTQLGKEYVWGAYGPDSYDCSGLTMMSWRNAGVNIPRTSREQYKYVLKIPYDQLRPGDLVFWTDDPNDANAIYHVAMWIGGGQIIEASRPGVPLRIAPMRWSSTMPYAGRP